MTQEKFDSGNIKWALLGLVLLYLLMAIFVQGCGLRRPYGAPCPPAPARSAVPHAQWDGKVWSCPPTADTWVDEGEALAGRKDFVYCVPKTPAEIKGMDEGQTDEPIAPLDKRT